jgi:serine/threonine-protein kinase
MISHSPISVRPHANEPTTLSSDHTAPPWVLPASGFFGRYQLLGEVKWGGMGVVYKARDTALDRIVALKMLKSGALAHPEAVERFQREARAVARLKHPHLVPLYDIGEHEGQHYLTMEYVAGGTLSQHLERLQKDTRAAVALLEKIARAVHYAHGKSILHRDLKPSNVLLDEQGEPHVSDFGLAKFLDAEALPAQPDSIVPGLSPLPAGQNDHPGKGGGTILTRTYGVVGTPTHMAPEQAAGQTVTQATDIWALGVLLYELLTGECPFPGKTRAEVVLQIQTIEPVRPRQLRPELDPALEAICLKCLEKDPARRYASADALADDLRHWLGRGSFLTRFGQSIRRQPLVSTATAILAAVLATAAIVVFLPPDPDHPLHQIRRQLTEGKEATLIGDEGPPAWSRWRLGRGQIKEDPERGNAFSFGAQEMCLLELLRDAPREGYQLRALVSHLASDKGGEVGLYFGYREYPTSRGVERRFCTLTFNDVKPSLPPDARLHRPAQSKVRWNVRRFWDDGPNLTGQTGIEDCFPPAAQRPIPSRPFRELMIDVTPEEIRAHWEGNLLGRLTRADLREYFGPKKLPTIPQDPGVELDADFHLGGGVGLFVAWGWAAFRQVVVGRATHGAQ